MVQPDPRLAVGTRYGRIWGRLVARYERRVARTYELEPGTAQWREAMELGQQALHGGMAFLRRYQLGAYSVPDDVVAAVQRAATEWRARGERHGR